MSYRLTRPFMPIADAINTVADTHFNGDKKEAIADILAALEDGELKAQGVPRQSNETGHEWLGNEYGDPEPISHREWRIFGFDPDKNELRHEITNSIADVYQATWFSEIKVERATVEKLWADKGTPQVEIPKEMMRRHDNGTLPTKITYAARDLRGWWNAKASKSIGEKYVDRILREAGFQRLKK